MNKILYEEEMIFLTESEKRAKIQEKLIQESKPLIAHLIKIYYWSSETPMTTHHWIKEVSNFCSSVSMIKGKNKFMTDEEIKNIIWGTWGSEEDLNDLIYELNRDRDYRSLSRIKYEPNLSVFCEEYINWLSIELGKKGEIDKRKSQEKLNNMIHAY